MAREESPHEDLFQVATALVQRLTLTGPAFPEPWLIGFRNDHSASFYLGSDPVYHFTPGGALHRAFVDGKLYKAERGQLVEMVRTRTATAVELRSRTLDPAASNAFLARLDDALVRLQTLWQQGSVTVTRQFPDTAAVDVLVQRWLADLPRPLAVAQQPGRAS